MRAAEWERQCSQGLAGWAAPPGGGYAQAPGGAWIPWALTATDPGRAAELAMPRHRPRCPGCARCAPDGNDHHRNAEEANR